MNRDVTTAIKKDEVTCLCIAPTRTDAANSNSLVNAAFLLIYYRY